MTDALVELVARGCDEVAERFLDRAQQAEGDPRLEWFEDLTARVPDGADVLELGCRAGEPITRLLSERFRATGMDANRRLVEQAGFAVPRDEIVRFVEPDHGDASFQWILAQR